MKLFRLLLVLCIVSFYKTVDARDLILMNYCPSTELTINPLPYLVKVAAIKPVTPIVATKRATKISAAFEGYAIVVATTQLPLLSDDVLFKQFGNLTYDQNSDGTYSYLILTPFTKKKNVRQFYEKVIIGRVPNASIVKYKAGMRK